MKFLSIETQNAFPLESRICAELAFNVNAPAAGSLTSSLLLFLGASGLRRVGSCQLCYVFFIRSLFHPVIAHIQEHICLTFYPCGGQKALLGIITIHNYKNTETLFRDKKCSC